MARTMQQEMDYRMAKSKKALADGLPNDETNKALDRAQDAQFGLATHHEDITLVALDKLRPYANHPFKAYSEDKMTALADSINRDGLQQPIIVRKLEDTQGWEILAGHNRVEAMRWLGKQDIPAIIRDFTDDQAALVVVETNLKQREKLLPSEKAFAYKLQMEALRGENAIIENGALPSDSKGLESGYQIDTQRKGQVLSGHNEDTYAQIFRYIRLTHLLPELLDKLDAGELPVMAGYELSFLDAAAQEEVCQFTRLCSQKFKFTLKHAEAIRDAFEAGKPVTVDTIPGIIQKTKKKPGPVNLTIPSKTLKRYAIPKGTDIEAVIHELLEERFGLSETA